MSPPGQELFLKGWISPKVTQRGTRKAVTLSSHVPNPGMQHSNAPPPSLQIPGLVDQHLVFEGLWMSLEPQMEQF